MSQVTTESQPAAAAEPPAATAAPSTYPPRLKGLQYRSTPLEVLEVRAAGAESPDAAGRIKVVISTEYPVEIYGTVEVLGHREEEVDLTFARGGLPLMLVHPKMHVDPQFHLGMVDDIQLETVKGKGRCLTGWADFSTANPLAVQIRAEVLSRHRRGVSVGQKPFESTVTKQPKKLGDRYEYRLTRWQPREVSIPSIHADPNAAFDLDTRSAEAEEYDVAVKPSAEPALVAGAAEPTPPATAAPATPPPETATPAAPATPPEAVTPPAPEPETATRQEATEMTVVKENVQPAGGAPAPAAAAVDITRTPEFETALKTRMAANEEIRTLCDSNGIEPRMAREWIEKGMGVNDVKIAIFEQLQARSGSGGRQPGTEFLAGLTERERDSYSFNRALQGTLSGRGAAESMKGLEGDVHRHLLKSAGLSEAPHGGILVPLDLRSDRTLQRLFESQTEGLRIRTMQSNVPGKGAELIAEARGEVIQLLTPNPVLRQLGARVFSGLSAPIVFPRITGKPTVMFRGENPNQSTTMTDLGTGQIRMSGKEMAGGTVLTRSLMMQTQGEAENDTRRLLLEDHDLALDRIGINGVGGENQPLGLHLLAGTQAVSAANVAPTYAKFCEGLGLILAQHARGSLGTLTTCRMGALLKSKLMFPGVASPPLWKGKVEDGTGEIDGYTAIGSEQVKSTWGGSADEHGFYLGAWRFCAIGLFGAMEILADPYTGAEASVIKIFSWSYGDVIFQHPEAFVVFTGAKLV